MLRRRGPDRARRLHLQDSLQRVEHRRHAVKRVQFDKRRTGGLQPCERCFEIGLLFVAHTLPERRSYDTHFARPPHRKVFAPRIEIRNRVGIGVHEQCVANRSTFHRAGKKTNVIERRR